MQEAVPVGEGSMIAVLSLQIDEVKKILQEHESVSGVCEIANDNANGQVIVSGNKVNLDKLQIKLKTNKIKFIPLKVSAPFHCSLMKPAAKMREIINIKEFKDPSVEIISNVTANPEKNSNVIKKLLIDQIFSTVRWRESLIHKYV